MNGEIISEIDVKIYQDIAMPDGGRIILGNPGYGWLDVDLNASNHNVFRLDAHNQVIWQVQRVETIGQMNWEVANRQAKEADPNCEGYFDPFTDMGNKFFERYAIPIKPSSYSRLECNPTVGKKYFDTYVPGSLLGLHTHRWAYDLDPETGIATCTGEQLK